MAIRYDNKHEIADITLGELARLVSALERARTILANMAQENEGAIFKRWTICHEPLRDDAKGLLPDIDDVLRQSTPVFGFPRSMVQRRGGYEDV